MAFPTVQAVGTVVESATLDVSPAWPVHLANDIGLLIVQSGSALSKLTTPQGFVELPFSPQRILLSSTLDNNLSVYWKRATSGAEPAPTVKWVADHVSAVIVTIRGASTVGRPFTAGAGKNAADSTAVSGNAITTTTADQLVVDILGHNVDSAGAKVSGWANANLTTLVEHLDNGSIIGSGSGIAVHSGQKAAAGAVAATTATLSTTSQQTIITLAFTAVEQPVDKMPFLKAIGTPVESASVAISPAWPTHVSGDIGLLVVESGGWPVVLGTPAGFVALPDSGQTGGISGSTAGTSLNVYWCRATSGAMAAPTVNFVADHVRAVIITLGNCISAGDPFDVTSGSGTAATEATVTIPGDTTTLPNTLVVGAATTSRDVASRNEFSAWASTGLNYVTERFEEVSLIGSGSGFAVVTGEKQAAGAYGDITGTVSSATHQGRMSVAIKGPSGGDFVADRGDFTLTGFDATLVHDRVLVADPGAFALSGFAADFPILRTFVLEADRGDFTLTGFDVQLLKTSRGWAQQLPEKTTWTKQTELEE